MKMKAFLALAGLLTLAYSEAVAQSSPNLANDQVPTAAQWNSYFASKQNYLGYVPVNKAGDTMFGRLVTAPSTAAAAGFNIAPGVGPNFPVNGDLWSTSSGLFVQINGTTIGPLGTGGGGGGGGCTPTGAVGAVQTNAGGGSCAGITNTQLTALINAATTSLPGALPAWPNTTTTYFRGDGTYARPSCSTLSDSTAFCNTNPASPPALGGTTPNTAAFTVMSAGQASVTTGQIKLFNSGNSNVVTIQPGATAATVTYTWPAALGSAGCVWTDAAGNGVLSCIASPSGNVPTGGTTGQALVKNSNTNFDTTWSTLSGTGTVTSITTNNGITGCASACTTTATIGLQAISGPAVLGISGAGPTVPGALTTLPVALMPALTGDVTSSAGSVATTVAKINGAALGSTTATAGNLLVGSGSLWASVASSGDVTVSSAGVFTIGANKVTLADMAQAPGLSLLGVIGTSTANVQAITGTASQFAGVNAGGTALAFQTMAGDATLAGPTLTLGANVVSNAKFRQSVGLSVVGRASASTGNAADIVGTANQALIVDPTGATLAFGAINLASSAAVTGNLRVANLAGGINASASTVWCGNGTWCNNGPSWYNVKAFGAKGDGVTNDTTAVNAAIAAMVSAQGGCVYFPAPGRYLVSTLTSVQATALTTPNFMPCVIGDDPVGSKIVTNQATGDVWTFTGDSNTCSTCAPKVYIARLGFGYSGAYRTYSGTNDAYLNLGGSGTTLSDIYLEDLRFNQCATCLRSASEAGYIYKIGLNEGQSQACASPTSHVVGSTTWWTCSGVTLMQITNAGGSLVIDGLYTGYEGLGQPNIGIDIQTNSGGAFVNVQMNNIGIVESGHCINWTSNSGVIGAFYMSNSFIDTCYDNHLNFNPTGTASMVGLYLSNNSINTSVGSSIFICNGGSGQVNNIRILNNIFGFSQSGSGVDMPTSAPCSGSPTANSFYDINIISNSSIGNANYGVSIGSGIKHFTILGNCFGLNCSIGNGVPNALGGIVVAGSTADHFIIAMNRLYNGGTGTACTVNGSSCAATTTINTTTQYVAGNIQ